MNINNKNYDSQIEGHHLHPRFMDNPKGLGKKRMLNRKEHIILHLIIPSIIWKYVPENMKQKCIDEVISSSEKYIDNLSKDKQKEIREYDVCDINNSVECKMCKQLFVGEDIDKGLCRTCEKLR